MLFFSPADRRISQTGVPCPRKWPLWKMARSGFSVTLNGMTVGEWLWMTAFTSGRSL